MLTKQCTILSLNFLSMLTKQCTILNPTHWYLNIPLDQTYPFLKGFYTDMKWDLLKSSPKFDDFQKYKLTVFGWSDSDGNRFHDLNYE